MKFVGYIDGKKTFVRDDVTAAEAERLAQHINDLTKSIKKRLVLFVEHEGITHMIRDQGPKQ